MPQLIVALPWLYVVTRWLWPLPWRVGVQTAVALVLLIASQFHYWSRLSSGSMFAPEFPRPVVVAFNWVFWAIPLLALFQIVLDLSGLVAMIAGSGDAVWVDARYAIAIIAFALAGIGVWQAIRVPPLRDVTVVLPGLPRAFEGYTLVHLTDLHISRLFPRAWTTAIVTATNALDVDLVVVTGDVIDGSVANREADVAPLRDLRARDGVYMSPGNHEYLSGYDAWMAHFATLGLRALTNSHAVITRGEDRLVVAGVTDPSARGANRPLPDLEAALAGVPADAPVILLDHQPARARQASEAGVALQLSGHTHGGAAIGIERLVARANGGFVSGRYAVGGMTLYVGNGTGIWPGGALRLGKWAELTRITLRGHQA